MKSNLKSACATKVVSELYKEGLDEHRYEVDFWKEAVGKRMDMPRQLKYIVWFCLELLKNLEDKFLTAEDSKGKIFSRSFQEVWEKYPQIHRLWFHKIIEIWVSKKSSIEYKMREKVDSFFLEILEGNIPYGYQTKDFLTLIVKESREEDLVQYLEIYEMVWKEKITLVFRRKNDREVGLKIFEILEKTNFSEQISREKHKLVECIGKVIWPVECDKNILRTSAKSWRFCEDIRLLQKARVRGLINEKEIDIYLEEVIGYENDLLAPYFIRIKYA